MYFINLLKKRDNNLQNDIISKLSLRSLQILNKFNNLTLNI